MALTLAEFNFFYRSKQFHTSNVTINKWNEQCELVYNFEFQQTVPNHRSDCKHVERKL